MASRLGDKVGVGDARKAVGDVIVRSGATEVS